MDIVWIPTLSTVESLRNQLRQHDWNVTCRLESVEPTFRFSLWQILKLLTTTFCGRINRFIPVRYCGALAGLVKHTLSHVEHMFGGDTDVPSRSVPHHFIVADRNRTLVQFFRVLLAEITVSQSPMCFTGLRPSVLRALSVCALKWNPPRSHPSTTAPRRTSLFNRRPVRSLLCGARMLACGVSMLLPECCVCDLT